MTELRSPTHDIQCRRYVTKYYSAEYNYRSHGRSSPETVDTLFLTRSMHSAFCSSYLERISGSRRGITTDDDTEVSPRHLFLVDKTPNVCSPWRTAVGCNVVDRTRWLLRYEIDAFARNYLYWLLYKRCINRNTWRVIFINGVSRVYFAAISGNARWRNVYRHGGRSRRPPIAKFVILLSFPPWRT